MDGPQEVLGELNRVLQQQQQQLQQQQNQPDNVEVEDDHDDDEEEEEEDDDDGIGRDADGTLDGGVAAGASSSSSGGDNSSAVPRQRAADCDLILYITCAETMDDIAPHHPILKQDVCVSIGLDKSTKLGAVFKRYAEFCNEHSRTKIEPTDLEFFHCQLLNGNDTAEASALMKNDKIKVRRERAAERETQQELKRLQRESDRDYFKQLRHLLPDLGGSKFCDVVFDCRGKHMDESGRNQQVLSTTVRGNSVVLEKRCRWLAEKIDAARQERRRQSVVTLPSPNEVKTDDEGDDGTESHQSCVSFQEEKNIVANTSSGGPEYDNDEDGGVRQRRSGSSEDMDMEEDEDEILGYPVPKNRPQGAVVRGGGATEIENDYDDDEDGVDCDHNSNADNDRGSRSRSPVIASSNNQRNATNSDLLWVTIPNHSPEAVKLLLEYCYTNRVVPLGQEAFVQACRTKPVKPKDGPVSPYSNSRRWPNGGLPEVSFSVALAGVALAEEAAMHRLSLMCEIAASNLLSGSNVVEALSMCTRQKELTGNPLTRLREVAINVVLRSGRGARGIYELPTFRRALEERKNSIIPTLFTGTIDVLSSSEKKKSEDTIAGDKRQFSTMTESHFNELDREDRYSRERERRQRRLERWEKDPELAAKHGAYHDAETGEVYCDPVLSNAWAAESARRSLKRMTHNMTVGSFHHNFASHVSFPVSRTIESLSRAPPNWGVKRRSSSRRRNSDRSS